MAVGPMSFFGSWHAALLFVSGLPLALVLIWRPKPPPLPAVALSDAGWSVRGVQGVGWGGSAFVVVLLFAAASFFSDTRAGLAIALGLGAWLPLVAVPTIQRSALGSAAGRRDDTLMDWLYDMRLLAACGLPVNAASSVAAQQVEDPAFDVVRSAIMEAVVSGHDPLRFAAERLEGRPIAGIIASIEAAERAGAATTGLLDEVLERSVASLENHRRRRIDRLARSVTSQITFLSISTGALLMVAVIFNLDF